MLHNVEMDIKVTERGNRFYIHKIKIAEGAPKLDRSRTKLNPHSTNNTVPQTDTDVITSISENFDIDTFSNNIVENPEYFNSDLKKSIKTTSEIFDYSMKLPHSAAMKRSRPRPN